MKPRGWLSLLVTAPIVLAATSVLAYNSGRLTNDEAERAIRQHTSSPKEFAVAVDGIAQGEGAAEAIVHDATAAVGQLVEQERRRKTVEWAKPRLDQSRAPFTR